jgi:hypothetical protein
LAVSVAAWDRGTVATPEATTPMSPGRAPRPDGTGRPRPLPGGRGRFVPVLPGLDDLPALREPTG